MRVEKSAYAQETKDRFGQLVLDLQSNIDYPKLLEHMSLRIFGDDRELNSTDFIHRHLADLYYSHPDFLHEDSPPHEHFMAMYGSSFFSSRIDKIKDFIAHYGEFVSNPNSETPRNTTVEEFKEKLTLLDDLEDQAYEYQILLGTYNLGEYYNPHRGIDPIRRMAANLGTMYRVGRDEEVPEQVVNNQLLMDAVVTAIDSSIPEWMSQGIIRRDETWYASQEHSELRKINFKITGLEPRIGYNNVVTPDTIHNWFILDPQMQQIMGTMSFLYAFPEQFFNNIGEVHFEHDEPYDIQPVDTMDSIAWIQVFKKEIKTTLVHEVFERNATELSLDEMQDYEAAIEDDQIKEGTEAVSWYVQYCKANPDNKSWKKEDFCETGALYVTEPAELYRIAPARFNYMVKYFAHYLPKHMRDDYMRIQTALVQKSNSSEPFSVKKAKKERQLVHQQIPLDALKEDPGKQDKSKTVGTFIPAEKKDESKKHTGHTIRVTNRLFIKEAQTP